MRMGSRWVLKREEKRGGGDITSINVGKVEF